MFEEQKEEQPDGRAENRGSWGGGFVTQNKGFDLAMVSHWLLLGREEAWSGRQALFPCHAPRPRAASVMDSSQLTGAFQSPAPSSVGFPAWERLWYHSILFSWPVSQRVSEYWAFHVITISESVGGAFHPFKGKFWGVSTQCFIEP